LHFISYNIKKEAMKNIHVIPTDKPSRLQKFMNHVVDKIEFELCSKAEFFNKGQHIYITNSEEIKEGDWFLWQGYGGEWFKEKCEYMLYEGKKTKHLNCNYKTQFKIILTDNKDLIADGVQAIDDEFLEWFVKNPSCEFVEVNKLCYGALSGFADAGYKIILPKEEPNPFELPKALPDDVFYQYLEEPKQKYKYIGECNGNNQNGCFLDSPAHDCGCFTRVVKDEPKQVSLEEIAKKYAIDVNVKRGGNKEAYQNCSRLDFITGVKSDAARDYWFEKFQQEQDKKMYNEKEVIEIVEKSRATGLTAEFLILTEQFKKK
jgi:hypothetical protein